MNNEKDYHFHYTGSSLNLCLCRQVEVAGSSLHLPRCRRCKKFCSASSMLLWDHCQQRPGGIMSCPVLPRAEGLIPRQCKAGRQGAGRWQQAESRQEGKSALGKSRAGSSREGPRNKPH